MTIRTKFLLFVFLLHAITLGLSLYIFWSNKLVFIALEFVFLLSLAYSWQLYQDLVQPLKLLTSGAEAIQDRDFNVKFLETGSYEMDKLISVYNAMIDQLRLERTQQQEQYHFLSKLVETSPTGILILDFDNRIERINPKATTSLRITEKLLLGKAIDTLQHPLLQAIAKLSSNESCIVNVNGIETYKCQKSYFIDRGFPRYFVMIEELTEEILEAEKKAYGKVIRMMAHEVNNSVGAVNSILETTLQSLDNYEADLKNALQVASDRNLRLIQFMRNFAEVVRLPMPRHEPYDLNRLAQGVSTLMLPLAERKGVTLEIVSAEETLPAQLDISQMEQVLINIVKNAIEACVKGDFVKVQSAHNQIIIKNNGRPISAEVEAQLFNPFFSTKPTGQGIGLTLTREILLNHGFSFSLKTDENGWTAFVINLHQ